MKTNQNLCGIVSTNRAVLLGLLLLLPAAAQAQYTYTTNNGAVTITGATCANPVVNIPGTLGGLPVRSIGDFAFSSCSTLTSVTIPNGVTNIGNSAFWNCTSLTSVTIPNTVTSIGNSAFWNCKLTSLTLPASVTKLGPLAFAWCTGLTSVTIPSSVTSVPDYAFGWCTNLVTATIPSSVTNIGNFAFYQNTRLTGVYFHGNAPPLGGSSVFSTVTGLVPATVYRLAGTTGWGATFGGLPTAVWSGTVLTFHPADSNSDWTIKITEVTAYGSAWKTGATWPTPPNPIPINYLTSTGLLWKNGEAYHYDANQTPPLSWVSGAAAVTSDSRSFSSVAGGVVAAGTSLATRALPANYTPQVAVSVAITVTPDAAVGVYAVEDAPPAGWTATGINNSGSWDAVNHKVKWGPFFDSTARTLSYQATPPAEAAGLQTFAGSASFDASNDPIGGASEINSAGCSYTITTTAAPVAGGTTSGGGTKACDTSVTVIATANTGYTFVNWTEAGTVVSASASYIFAASANRTLVANFTGGPSTYTIGTSSAPAAGGSTTGGGSYASNAVVQVTATASNCYTFVNWTEAGTNVSASTTYIFLATRNRTLVANFQPSNYLITTTAGPVAGGTTSGGGTKACGTSVTVIATANTGYTFVNWTEGGTLVSGSASYLFTASANRTLVANFTAAAPTAATPTITPAAGTYSTSVLVTLSTSTPGATLRYTTNGTDPTSSSPSYSGPFPLLTSATVKAIAFATGYNPSAMAAASYTIVTPAVNLPVIVVGPVVTNALLQVGNQAVVVAGETNVFNVTATGPSGHPLSYQWNFGDGTSTALTPQSLAQHAYATNCGSYAASVTVSNDFGAITSNFTVAVACELTVSKLAVGVNFAPLNKDKAQLKGQVDLGPVTLAGLPVIVDIGGAQVTFTLDAKGKAKNGSSSCRLAPAFGNTWTLTVKFSKGTWRDPWADVGLVNDNILKPGVVVMMPVTVLIGAEAFATERALTYTAKAGKSGKAK